MTEREDILVAEAAALLGRCRAAGVRLVTAESCTGGLIAATLTAVAGSSDVFDRAFVIYSNRAKTEMLGIDEGLIETEGAVSEAVALAMAAGALARSDAGLAVAVTGVAGPAGGSADKPVGRVHIAVADSGGRMIHRRMDYGDTDRAGVRRASVADAFGLVNAHLNETA